MGIYAALGVPEVWRFDGETLRVEQLQADGTYAAVTDSPSFPFLPPEEVVRWVAWPRRSKMRPNGSGSSETGSARLAPRVGA